MKKVFVSLFVVFSICVGCLYAAKADESSKISLVKVKIEYPNADMAKSWRLMARYKDNKNPIALSSYYDGYVL